MIEIWKKASGEWAGQIDKAVIYSAASAEKLIGKLERAGISSQPIRLVADNNSYMQWGDFAGFLRAISQRAA